MTTRRHAFSANTSIQRSYAAAPLPWPVLAARPHVPRGLLITTSRVALVAARPR